VIEGIVEYAAEYGPWQFFVEPRGRYEQLKLPDNWQGEGVIARVNHAALAEQLIDRNIPAIDVSWYSFGDQRIARVTIDEVQSAHVCAEYYFTRGFRCYAYCSSLHRPGYIDRFGEIFLQLARQRGFPTFQFSVRQDLQPGVHWNEEMDELREWLNSLPKPVAVLTLEGVRGRQIIEACHLENIRVPDDVAVLADENDELSIKISQPSLSSNQDAGERVGWKAAEVLDAMMAGHPPPTAPVLVPSAGVVTRQSTDTLAIPDRELAKAIRFIRQNAHRAIQVSDVLQQVDLSRRTLEQRLQTYLGRTPAEEIRLARIQLAKRLLAETNDPMPKIAAHSGFEFAEVLSRVFRRELGMTPTAYRRMFRR
jgi:LacI family transcriptional regulator